jgi:hypothetical protein
MVRTSELDTLAAETAAYMVGTCSVLLPAHRRQATVHPNYEVLAGRIAMSNLHKETQDSFAAVVKQLRDYVNPKTKLHSPLIAEDVYAACLFGLMVLH